VAAPGGCFQQQAAQLLATTQSRLSRIETGDDVICDVEELHRVASVIGVAPERFGVLAGSEAGAATGLVKCSLREWRGVRRELNNHRAVLGDLAAELCPGATRVGTTGVLTQPDWTPAEPVELDRVELQWMNGFDHPELRVNGDGSAIRDYLHVEDMADAVCLALSACRPGQWTPYNVGSGRGASIRDLLVKVPEVTGQAVPVSYGPPVLEPRELVADSSRIRAALGWDTPRSDIARIVADAWKAT